VAEIAKETFMQQLHFDNIQIGGEIPSVQKNMTQEVINRWAKIAKDFNPLHTNPEHAKTTRFGGTIAHGYISLCYLNQMMVE